MKVDILASGSKGNCIALTSGSTTILIDAGVAKTKIEKALLNAGITPDQIVAIFITHAHGDHIKGLPIANKYQIPVYASPDEWNKIGNVDVDNKHDIGVNTPTCFDPFVVESFSSHHDSFDPVGYAIYAGDLKTSICLDTGRVDEDMFTAMSNSDIYILESNHEPAMVEQSDYPNSVKARILSHIGHLSNEQAAEALSKLIQGRGEQIYLTHLSQSNNVPALAEMTTVRALKKKGFIKDKHYRIEVI